MSNLAVDAVFWYYRWRYFPRTKLISLRTVKVEAFDLTGGVDLTTARFLAGFLPKPYWKS
jgi:hypothetical protein